MYASGASDFFNGNFIFQKGNMIQGHSFRA